MIRRVLLGCSLLACAFSAWAVAGSARVPKAPVVTSIAPKTLRVGDTLTIRGRNFIPGKNKNSVAFQRPRARAVFLKADRATRTTLKVTITSRVAPYLSTSAGKQQPTRFGIRVLSRRFAARFTSKRLSPVIRPGKGPATAPAGCTPVPTSNQIDSDNDLLPDAVEVKYKLDSCKPDTDRDGMEDGWEYYSALDLNGRAVPYPGKRPYPNPLDGSDAGIDHDGDGLTQYDEYAAWVRYGGHRLLSQSGNLHSDLFYSDGTQVSYQEPIAGLAENPVANRQDRPWLDANGDEVLQDDERDADGDGLSNYDEAYGLLTSAWWVASYENEKPYTTPYPELDWLDWDTDGDSVPDGADDQDHDDVSNLKESIGARAGKPLFGLRAFDAFINPYNPCLPNYRSRTCSKHPPAPDNAYPPFDTATPKPLPQLPYGGDIEPQLHWPIDWRP
jgi:hypothetical protein